MDLRAIRVELRARLIEPVLVVPKRPGWRRCVAIAAAVIIALPVLALAALYAGALMRETQSAVDLAPNSGRFVQTTQGKLFVQESGPLDGPPVILIHGTAAWSELWRETIDHLVTEKFRVIAIDLPPFGFSARPKNRDYTRAAHAERIAALIDALNLGPVFLVGHSFGAGPTVETVMKFPRHVRGLVLIDGALGISEPNGPQPAPTIVTAVLETPFVRNPLVAAFVTNPWMTRRLVQSMVYRREAVTDARVAVLQRPMRLADSTSDLGRWLGYFTAIDRAAWSMDRARYAAIATRTVLIWGEQDTLTPLAQAHDIQSLIAGARLTILPGLGHIPQIEDPAILAPALAAALRSML